MRMCKLLLCAAALAPVAPANADCKGAPAGVVQGFGCATDRNLRAMLADAGPHEAGPREDPRPAQWRGALIRRDNAGGAAPRSNRGR